MKTEAKIETLRSPRAMRHDRANATRECKRCLRPRSKPHAEWCSGTKLPQNRVGCAKEPK